MAAAVAKERARLLKELQGRPSVDLGSMSDEQRTELERLRERVRDLERMQEELQQTKGEETLS